MQGFECVKWVTLNKKRQEKLLCVNQQNNAIVVKGWGQCHVHGGGVNPHDSNGGSWQLSLFFSFVDQPFDAIEKEQDTESRGEC